jgi:uracil phosphoribosyltransferase
VSLPVNFGANFVANFSVNFRLSEVDHSYGENVHLLQDPCLSSWLARLCSPDTDQPQINTLVRYLYTGLLQTVMNAEFPLETCRVPTRMTTAHPDQLLATSIFRSTQRVITVNLARAGTYPSHLCYDLLNNIMNPKLVRQDHILASRMTDDSHQVTGTALGGAKIGGDVDNAMVIFPDPMGATGNTLISAVDHYKRTVAGRALKYLALHLIVTPEYLKNVQAKHPELVIYAARLDRGLSSARALEAKPGVFWDEERGLNDQQYIVPGGGGFGEIMNNSFV